MTHVFKYFTKKTSMRWRTGINRKLDMNLANEAEMERTQYWDGRNLNWIKGWKFPVWSCGEATIDLPGGMDDKGKMGFPRGQTRMRSGHRRDSRAAGLETDGDLPIKKRRCSKNFEWGGVEAEPPKPGQRKSWPERFLYYFQKPNSEPDYAFGRRKAFNCFWSVQSTSFPVF